MPASASRLSTSVNVNNRHNHFGEVSHVVTTEGARAGPAAASAGPRGCHRRVRRRLLNEQIRCAGRERQRRHARSALQAATEEGRPGRAATPHRTPAPPYRHVSGARLAKGCRRREIATDLIFRSNYFLLL